MSTENGRRRPAANGHGGSSLGERLRSERTARGLSLRELARRAGVSPSLLSQIETAKIFPSVGTLYAIVRELGVSIDEIFVLDDVDPGPSPQNDPPAPAPRSAARPAAHEPTPVLRVRYRSAI